MKFDWLESFRPLPDKTLTNLMGDRPQPGRFIWHEVGWALM
jgi:hypothetical protein